MTKTTKTVNVSLFNIVDDEIRVFSIEENDFFYLNDYAESISLYSSTGCKVVGNVIPAIKIKDFIENAGDTSTDTILLQIPATIKLCLIDKPYTWYELEMLFTSDICKSEFIDISNYYEKRIAKSNKEEFFTEFNII